MQSRHDLFFSPHLPLPSLPSLRHQYSSGLPPAHGCFFKSRRPITSRTSIAATNLGGQIEQDTIRNDHNRISINNGSESGYQSNGKRWLRCMIYMPLTIIQTPSFSPFPSTTRFLPLSSSVSTFFSGLYFFPLPSNLFVYIYFLSHIFLFFLQSNQLDKR